MKKMIMAVIPKNLAEKVLKKLTDAGHTATFTESRGGILRQTQYSLFIAVEEDDVDKVCGIIRENSSMDVSLDQDGDSGFQTMNAGVGGVVVFVWDLNDMEVF